MFFRANPWKANSQTHNGVLPMKLNSSIAKLFDTLDEAVIAAGNGKIIYANTSAENLFGGRLQDAKALDRFDPLLLDTPGDIVYGSVRRGNEFLPAAAVTLGALRIITVSFPRRTAPAATSRRSVPISTRSWASPPPGSRSSR